MIRFWSIAIVLSICVVCHAQKPTIISVDKRSGAYKDIVSISGTDFGTDASKLTVFFGSVSAEIKSVTNQLLVVLVPAGTTFDQIIVTNTTSKLSSASSEPFFINFSGNDPLDVSSFSTPQQNFDAFTGLYDLCLCDFNNDGKNDVLTASDNSNSIAIMENTSTPGAVQFNVRSRLLNKKTLHVACADLNGDGLSDAVTTEANDGAEINILRNTGSFNFNAMAPIAITGRKVKKIAIADLDNDGKPELIITDQSTTSNVITILPNTSTNGTISFASPVNITVPLNVGTDGLEVRDLNNDGRPELIAANKLSNDSKIFVCKNNSNPGNFNFQDVLTLNAPGGVINVKAGDLDNDGKPEIAATLFSSHNIVVFRNTSTSQISFATAAQFALGDGTWQNPWGLDFGDLNGDGLLDIAVAGIKNTSLRILENQSTSGTLNFKTALDVPTDFINRHISIGDIDGDAKPDLAFTSVDFNGNNPIPASKVSVIRNLSCFVPKISPENQVTICSGTEYTLTSNQNPSVTYSWTKDNNTIPSENTATLVLSEAGTYQAVATSAGCSKTSNEVIIQVAPGAGLNPGEPDASSNSPVCTGSTLNLTVTDLGADVYQWKGPGGFSASGRTPSVTNFTTAKAGFYIVELIKNGCISKIDTTLVEAITNPEFEVTFSGSEIICEGIGKMLTVSPLLPSGFTYQWYKDGQEVNGETNPTYQAVTSGEYSLEVISNHPGCFPVMTDELALTTLSVPEANFDVSAQNACVGQVLSFTQTSTNIDPAGTVVYSWDFRPGQTATGTSATHIYPQPGEFNAKLTVSYEGACANEKVIPITIISAPNLNITSSDNSFKICETGGSKELSVTGSNFTEYQWSTNETTPTIEISQAGTYSVTVTTEEGCVLEVERVIEELDVFIDINASKTTIDVGETVNLTLVGGFEEIIWRPGHTLNDSTIAVPIATPLQTTTYTVFGTDINGCAAQASITIEVQGTSALTLIHPKKYFSPNGDSDNQFWTIDNILSFSQCELVIYNDKGSKVYEAKPYLNDWDGTYKGSQLPAGVYYYVIRCDGESGVKTGSVSLLK